MIQITGLTKIYRRGRPPAVLDLTFDARPGVVTALLGPEGAGKTTALRLMLELERGKGITLFDGCTYRSLRRPEREVGVLLPTARTVAGHPGRKARGHLQMLAAAAGVPARRADELLEQTRLATVADYRLRAFSPGMNRRLALAAALLGNPRRLLLDAPTEGLSPRNVEWFQSFLRSFAVAGGTVLVTTRTPQEAAQVADRVITLDQGRLVADQPVGAFRRTRLRPEVAVRGPQMARLADLLVGQGALVRRDGGVSLAVAGIGRTEIGELAYRHGILLHELADCVVEQPAPPHAVLPTSSGRSGHVQVQQGRQAQQGRPRSQGRQGEGVPNGRQGDTAPGTELPGPPRSGVEPDTAARGTVPDAAPGRGRPGTVVGQAGEPAFELQSAAGTPTAGTPTVATPTVATPTVGPPGQAPTGGLFRDTRRRPLPTATPPAAPAAPVPAAPAPSAANPEPTTPAPFAGPDHRSE